MCPQQLDALNDRILEEVRPEEPAVRVDGVLGPAVAALMPAAVRHEYQPIQQVQPAAVHPIRWSIWRAGQGGADGRVGQVEQHGPGGWSAGRFHLPLNVLAAVDVATDTLMLRIEYDGQTVDRAAAREILEMYVGRLGSPA